MSRQNTARMVGATMVAVDLWGDPDTAYFAVEPVPGGDTVRFVFAGEDVPRYGQAVDPYDDAELWRLLHRAHQHGEATS